MDLKSHGLSSMLGIELSILKILKIPDYYQSELDEN
jgi:hypothetical protein